MALRSHRLATAASEGDVSSSARRRARVRPSVNSLHTSMLLR